jgi:tetratricopeptide (TPR) repeat protein
MNKVAKIRAALLPCMIFISGCHDTEKGSPYKEILSRSPFAALSDSIKNNPGNDGLWFRRAVLLNTNNYPEPALADFKKAWSLKKEEKYALGISTILLERKPDSAILFLTQALEDVPGSLLLRLSLARGYAATNKPDDALKICDDILHQNPQQVDVLKLMADLLDKKGDSVAAMAILENARHITPFDVELNYILALRYAEAKNPRVLVICDSLIKADSAAVHAEPYYYKGIYYANINNKAMAFSLFDQAVKHDYNFLDGYIEKGSILYEAKKYDEAQSVFNLALTISPRFADAYYWIAKCQEATGKKEEAKVNYLRAYELDKELKEAKEAAEKIIN